MGLLLPPTGGRKEPHDYAEPINPGGGIHYE